MSTFANKLFPFASNERFPHLPMPRLDVAAGVKRTINLLDSAVSDKGRAKEQEKQDATCREREAKERAEKEYLTQLRHEQEQAARRAELAAWQQAATLMTYPPTKTISPATRKANTPAKPAPASKN